MTPSPLGSETNDETPESTGPGRRGPTRRQALMLAGGSAAALGAFVGPFSGLFSAGAADGDDAEGDDSGPGPSPEMQLAGWLMGLESAAAELYNRARDSFDDAGRHLASTCAAHHTAQAAALGEMVTAGGGETADAPNKAFTERYGADLDAAGDATAKANFFSGLENDFAATYQASFDTLTSPSLAALAAKILATDAAQAVAWSAAAHGGEGDGLPDEGAIPESQGTDGKFDDKDLPPNPPEEEPAADDGATDDTAGTEADAPDSAEGGAATDGDELTDGDEVTATETGEDS